MLEEVGSWMLSHMSQGFSGSIEELSSRERLTKGPRQLGELTEEELRAYDGSDPKKPLLMAIKGHIYDVSHSRRPYGPGGPYACFAAKDASRALAKMSFDEGDLIGDISGLGPSELQVLSNWEYKFMNMYVKVGTLKRTEPVADADASETTETSTCTIERGTHIEGKATAEAPNLTSERDHVKSKGKRIADAAAENKHVADAEPKNVAEQKKVAVKDRNRRVSFTADIVYRLVPPIHHCPSKIK